MFDIFYHGQMNPALSKGISVKDKYDILGRVGIGAVESVSARKWNLRESL